MADQSPWQADRDMLLAALVDLEAAVFADYTRLADPEPRTAAAQRRAREAIRHARGQGARPVSRVAPRPIVA